MSTVENIVAKGEIAHHGQFLLLPQCFQKLSIQQRRRKRLYEGKGKVSESKLKGT